MSNPDKPFADLLGSLVGTQEATIIIDGKTRPRHDARGQPLGFDDSEITRFWRRFGDSQAVDDAGRPIPFFHGTAARFGHFSSSAHRTVLNERYQGDAFHFSTELDVARKYAFAARNQVFNKQRIFEEVDRAIPADLAAVFKSVVDKGHKATWDIPDEEVSAILASARRAGIDLDDLLDLAEFVEGSNYDLGRKQHFDAGMIFGGSVRHFPDWARESAEAFGLGTAAPSPRVVFAYLKCDRLLRTSSREEAKGARDCGYDSVLFEGADCVDGVAEWAVFEPAQICGIGSLENLHTDSPSWAPVEPDRQWHVTAAICAPHDSGRQMNASTTIAAGAVGEPDKGHPHTTIPNDIGDAMFEKSNSLVLFHGTSEYFERFDETSTERGCQSEPNNRLGIWATQDLLEAALYADSAGAEEGKPCILVLEAQIEPGNVAAISVNLDDFVKGDLANYGGLDILGDVFDDAFKSEGAALDRGAAFARARQALRAAGYEAMWIETGDSPMMAVFDPGKLVIRERLTEDEANRLHDRLTDRGWPWGGDLLAEDVEEDLRDIVAQRASLSTRMRP